MAVPGYTESLSVFHLLPACIPSLRSPLVCPAPVKAGTTRQRHEKPSSGALQVWDVALQASYSACSLLEPAAVQTQPLHWARGSLSPRIPLTRGEMWPVSFGGLTSPKRTLLPLQGSSGLSGRRRGARILGPFPSWLITEVKGQSQKHSSWMSPEVLGVLCGAGLGTSIGPWHF